MISDHDQFKPKFANILSSLEQFYMVTHMDGEGSITHTNSIFLQTSKWTPKRVLGKTLWQMFSDTTEGQKQAQVIWEHVLNGKTWFGTVEKVTRLGDPYFVQMTAIPSMQEDDKLNSVLFLELDITEDIELRDRLQQIAFIDYETGLMSRHHLETTTNELISKNESFAFVYIKIDHFYTLKELDTSESGIEIIQAFSNRLKRFFQDNSIARVGVNEFVVLTSFGDWFIQGFLDFLKQNPIYINNTAIPLSVSGGIIRFPEDQKTYTHLMRAALTATKDASDQGGGKITALSKASHIKLNRKSIIDRKLITALRDNELQVVYQPQIDVSTGKALLYEALIRWNDDELGSIAPDELIPIAEENGLIHEIGAFVLTESANLAAKWHAEGHAVKIAVNSSVREFSNPNLKDEIANTLKVA